MTFIVATNVIASRPPERRPTGTPHIRANSTTVLVEPDQNLGINKIPIARPIFVWVPGLLIWYFLLIRIFLPRLAFFGPVWPHMALFGPIWPHFVPLGPAWSHRVPLDPTWPCCLTTFQFQFQCTLRSRLEFWYLSVFAPMQTIDTPVLLWYLKKMWWSSRQLEFITSLVPPLCNKAMERMILFLFLCSINICLADLLPTNIFIVARYTHKDGKIYTQEW